MSEIATLPQMRLPMQSAPVDRVPGASRLQNGSGMEPSWGFSDIFDTVKGVVDAVPAPVWGGLASMI